MDGVWKQDRRASSSCKRSLRNVGLNQPVEIEGDDCDQFVVCR